MLCAIQRAALVGFQSRSVNTCEKYSLKPGDILFARTGATVGKVALIQSEAPECIAGTYFIVMRFSDVLNALYVRSVLNRRPVKQSFGFAHSNQLNRILAVLDCVRYQCHSHLRTCRNGLQTVSRLLSR